MILDKMTFLELVYSMPYIFLHDDGIDFLSLREVDGKRPDVKAVSFPFKRTTDLGTRCLFITKEIYDRIVDLNNEDVKITESYKDGKHFLRLNEVKIQTTPTKYKVS